MKTPNYFSDLAFRSYNQLSRTCSYYFSNSEKDLFVPFNKLPFDIIRQIFEMLTKELSNLALVSHEWREIVDQDEFIAKILPFFIFGKQDWCDKLNAIPKNVPHLPRCAYGFEKCMVTLIPDTVEIRNKDGSFREEPFTLPLFGKLIENSNSEHKISYDLTKNVGDVLTDSTRKNVSAYWEVIEEEAVGKGLEFEDQKNLVKDKGRGIYIPGLLATIVSVATRFIKTGECFFYMDPEDLRWYSENKKSTVVRLEEPDGTRIAVLFEFSLLHGHIIGLCKNYYIDYNNGYSGVAVGGKPIGTVKS